MILRVEAMLILVAAVVVAGFIPRWSCPEGYELLPISPDQEAVGLAPVCEPPEDVRLPDPPAGDEPPNLTYATSEGRTAWKAGIILGSLILAGVLLLIDDRSRDRAEPTT